MPSLPSSRPEAALFAPPRRGKAGTAWRWVAGLLFVVWSLALVAWLTLHWGILPRLEHWRPQIEQRLGQALGVPVSIGAIRVRSGGWVPALELDDVRLLDRQGRTALQLGHVAAALAPTSLLSGRPRLAQLHLDGVQLDVRRDADGRLHVAGLDLAADAGDVAPRADATAWLLAQQEFVIRRGILRWTDERSSAGPLVLSDVDLVLRNGLRSHALRLDATPPAAWGERFALRGRFTQPLIEPARERQAGAAASAAGAADGADVVAPAPAPWRHWRGTLYADLPHADVAELGRHVQLPFELGQGRGALRAWLEIDGGRPVGATADLALEAVALRLAPQLPPLALSRLHGRVTTRLTPASLELAVDGLRFDTDDGLTWAPGRLALSLALATDRAARSPDMAADVSDVDAVVGGRLDADRLDLATVAGLGARLPLPQVLHRTLATLAPQGRVSDLALQWRGPPTAPRSWQAGLRVEGLALAAGPVGTAADGRPPGAGRPGLRGAAIELQASESGGQARLRVVDGAVVLPGVFAEPDLPLTELRAALQWRVGAAGGAAPAIELEVQDMRFANADLRGSLAGRWRTGPPGSAAAAVGTDRGRPDARFPGALDLQGRIDEGRTERVARYLPLALPASTRQWVARAIGPGRLRDGEFQLRGELDRFPFTDGSPGSFRVRARAEGMALAYAPSAPGWDSPWPAMLAVSGELEFDRARLRIRDAQAQLSGVALRSVHGGIEDLVTRPVLQLEGQGRGPLAAMLGFVNATPVGDWSGGALAQASAGGAAELDLALAIPIDAPAAATVRGALTLAGNDLRLRPGVPLLGMARGRVDFSHQGFQVVAGRARVLGGDASFEGGSQADGTLRFHGQGQTSAEALRAATDVPALAPLARLGPRLRGQAPYRVELAIAQGRPALRLTSSLTGLAIDLPAPMNKPAAEAWPLTVQVSQPALAGGDGGERLAVDVERRLQARLERGPADAAPPAWRGAIGVGTEAPPLPARGVTARLVLPSVDLDAWHAAVGTLATTAMPATPGANTTPATPDAADATAAPGLTGAAGAAADAGRGPGAGTDGSADLAPTEALLRADALTFAGRRFDAVTLEWQRQPQRMDTRWTARLRSEQAEGTLEYHQPRAAGAPGRLQARLTRLALAVPPGGPDAPATAAAAARPDARGASQRAPADGAAGLPALDLVVDDFRWRGMALGRLEVEAVNLAPGAGAPPASFPGAGREWRLDRLRIRNDDAELTGQGRWSPGQRMALDFGLALADSGRFATRMGMPGVLQGGAGRIEGALSWPGSPLAPQAAGLDGTLRIRLGEGRFLQAEPGVARLLGVLSLQSLPRRLLLDFRDVFQQGFAFDQVSGDVRITRGVAETDNLRLIGVQAGVLVEGRADLRAETQDLHIVVVPELNAGAASLAVAAINPVVGLGTFLAQLLLRQPMMAAGTREFSVTGPWADPRVQRLERAAPPGGAASGPPEERAR
jgi:uncharacterized protein (TIGR02099 family)